MSIVSTVCPNIDLNLEHKDVKLTSPSAVTMRQWISTSYSNVQASFSCPPPSTGIFIDRCIMMSLPVSISFVGTSTPPTLLQRGKVALRAYPLASNTTSVILTINNMSYTIQVSELVPYMARFWKQSHFSTYPSYMDTYQNYLDGYNANNNPLGTYADDVFNNQLRGGFPIFVVNSTDTTGVINGTIYEPIWLPVLHREFDDGLGFINVKTMDLVVNYSSNLSRFISHAIPSITSITTTLGQPTLFMKYSTPPLGYVPRTISYGSEDLNRFITPIPAVNLAPNATVANFTSTNIQLNAIPKWVLIFARESNNNLTAMSTDTALNIYNISINFDNVSGILSSCSENDIYKISQANNLQTTWEQWHGTTTDFSVTGTTGNQIGTVGSYLKLYFGKDISLQPGRFPGMVGAFNFSMNISVKNINQSNNIVNPVLYIITSTSQRVIIHENGLTEAVLGISGEEGEYMPFHSAMKHYGGSFQDFISKVRHFFKPAVDFLKKTKLVSNVASLIPHPIAQTIGSVARNMGFGDGEYNTMEDDGNDGNDESDDKGGMMVGGKVLTRAQLMRRIKKLA